MNYQDAIQRILKSHLRTWGCFFRDLPELKGLTQPQTQAILLERALEMRKLMDEEKVGILEFSRFFQEFEVICLMLVICAWGAVSEEIPITEEDFGNVEGAISDLCVAGWAEEGKEVLDTAKRLLVEGLKSRQFPLPITRLLTQGPIE